MTHSECAEYVDLLVQWTRALEEEVDRMIELIRTPGALEDDA